jgi:hypothetical protein
MTRTIRGIFARRRKRRLYTLAVGLLVMAERVIFEGEHVAIFPRIYGSIPSLRS